MKTINSFFTITLMAAITLFTISCQKEDSNVPMPSNEKVTLRVNVMGSDISTKSALNTEGEKAISKAEIFVFNSDSEGLLDVYGVTTEGTSLTLNCTTGNKVIYALVNGNISGDILSTIDTKSKFLQTMSSLSSNSLTKFEMIGSTTETISSNSEVNVSVARLVSRIGIQSIKTNFTADAYKNMEFILKKIYIVNAVLTTNYSIDYTPDFASGTDIANFKRNLGQNTTFTVATKNETIANGGTLAANEYFYTYPNPTTTDCQDSSTNPRFTRLVIEATLGGTTYYYPISIVGASGTLENNKAYTIKSLTITRPGSKSPDVPFEITSNAIQLDVQEWDETVVEDSQI